MNSDAFIGKWLTLHTSVCLYNIYKNTSNLKDTIWILGGVYFADMFSGLVHIFFDKREYKLENIEGNDSDESSRELSVLRRINDVIDNQAHSFQLHHERPRFFIIEKKLYNPLGQREILLYLSMPTIILTKVVCDLWGFRIFGIFMYTFNLVATFSQILHGFAHRTRSELPFIVRFLQDNRLILTPIDHHKHHINNDVNFTIVNGWSNNIVNKIYVWFYGCK